MALVTARPLVDPDTAKLGLSYAALLHLRGVVIPVQLPSLDGPLRVHRLLLPYASRIVVFGDTTENMPLFRLAAPSRGFVLGGVGVCDDHARLTRGMLTVLHENQFLNNVRWMRPDRRTVYMVKMDDGSFLWPSLNDVSMDQIRTPGVFWRMPPIDTWGPLPRRRQTHPALQAARCPKAVRPIKQLPEAVLMAYFDMQRRGF